MSGRRVVALNADYILRPGVFMDSVVQNLSNNAKDAQVVQAQSDEEENSQAGFFPVTRLKREYLDYLAGKADEIEEQKEARHYYHGVQWSPEEIKILRARKQPIVTYNRIARKIDGVTGLVERLRQDPKAFPRHPRNEEGAEVATAVLRYALDRIDWRTKSAEVARQAAIEGIAGIELTLEAGDHGDPDIAAEIIAGDDFFYDPRSFRTDFSDARYMGIAKWVDLDAAKELFPDKTEVIDGLIDRGSDLTTHSDRETKWITANEKRVRLVEQWYVSGGEWCWAFYVGDTLLDEGGSPFRDERGKTFPRFIMISAAIDHDGDRYGFVRNMKGPQDEINQRRSKALHISNARRLILEKGAVDDIEITRREWARPDGVIEKNPGKSIAPDNQTADLESQLQFLEEAKNEIENFGPNPALLGQGVDYRSGRAISLLQQAGVAELGPYIFAYRGWKLRVYRAIWNIVQQSWAAERWIRVSDDPNLNRFIQINGLGLDPWGRPALVNALGALDVDIIVEEGPDVVNMMADTYDTLSALAQSGAQIPAQVLIELAPIQASVKQRILTMLEPPPPDPAAASAAAAEQRLIMEGTAATVGEIKAKALHRVAQAAHELSQTHANAADVFREGVQAAGLVPAVSAHSRASGNPAKI
jgi:hypothetical protein